MSAKNKEAQSGINRFLAFKNREAGILETNPNLRPKYVQKEKSLPQADKWRSVILGEISSKLTKINDPAVNDYQIRDLNDEINRLLKEKRAWEHHIIQLGGTDYINLTGKGNIDQSGIQVNGYRYFGRAKELPDVKKVLEEREAHKKSYHVGKDKAREEKAKFDARERRLDDEYYGYDDMVDSVGSTKETYNEVGRALKQDDGYRFDETNTCDDSGKCALLVYERERSLQLEEESHDALNSSGPSKIPIIQDSEIPTADDVKQWLLERRRKELLAKLIS